MTPDLKHLQGVWLQTGLDVGGEKVELTRKADFERIRCIWIIQDDFLAQIYRAGPGLRVGVNALTHHGKEKPAEINLVSKTTGRTTECLFRADKDNLTLCHGLRGAGSPRPNAIEAKRDVDCVETFKRLMGATAHNSRTQSDGIWKTVGFEMNGERLEVNDDGEPYECRKEVWYVDGEKSLRITARDWVLNSEAFGFRVSPNDKTVIELFRSDSQMQRVRVEKRGDMMAICWDDSAADRPPIELATRRGDAVRILRLQRLNQPNAESRGKHEKGITPPRR